MPARTSIAPHLGDIMSSRSTTVLLSDEFTSLERIVLTANGNLQRIVSAYHNKPVTVEILYNRLRNPDLHSSARTSEEPEPAIYDRQVELWCCNQVFCVATSEVVVNSEAILDLVNEKKVGIGQLFRYLNVLPSFELLSVGRHADGIERTYTLSTAGVVCKIHERFSNNLFNLR